MKVVFTPAALVCEKGMDTPWPMLDSTLSSVTARGELIVLIVPLFSAADRRRFRFAEPPALPRTNPMPAPLLRPMGAGMLTAKFGCVTPFKPASGADGSSAAPAAWTMLGKMSPVGLPVVGANETLPPHWIPTCREKLVAASTMRLSISTSGVCVSRLRTMPSARSSASCTSFTMSVLVRLSTETVPRSVRVSLSFSTSAPASA